MEKKTTPFFMLNALIFSIICSLLLIFSYFLTKNEPRIAFLFLAILTVTFFSLAFATIFLKAQKKMRHVQQLFLASNMTVEELATKANLPMDKVALLTVPFNIITEKELNTLEKVLTKTL